MKVVLMARPGWLRINNCYSSGSTLENELRVLRASLNGFSDAELDQLVKPKSIMVITKVI